MREVVIHHPNSFKETQRPKFLTIPSIVVERLKINFNKVMLIIMALSMALLTNPLWRI